MPIATLLVTITIAGIVIASFNVAKNMPQSDIDTLVDSELDEKGIRDNLRQDMEVTYDDDVFDDE
jgi:hypothetical protein